MAHIEEPRRNKDGSWRTRVRYRIGGRGSRLQAEPFTGFESRDECLTAAGHWANDFERRKYLGQISPQDAGATMDCAELAELYVEHHVDVELADNSRDYYTAAIPIYFTPFFRGKAVLEVTPLDGLEWRKWLIKEAAARSTSIGGRAGLPTVIKMIPIARGIFGLAKTMLFRPDNPLEDLKCPKVRKASARKRKWAPTAKEIEAIRFVISSNRTGTKHAWVRARDRLLVSMMGYQGCRQQDLYPAQWWHLIDENGNVRHRFLIGDGKTRAAERQVKLWNRVRREIKAYYILMGRPDFDTLVFPGIRGAELSRHNWGRDSWKHALANARRIPGFEKLPHFGPHKLRAGCATMLGYALTPQHVAMSFLGHEDWTTTMRYYLVAFEEAEELEGVPVEEQINRGRREFAAILMATNRPSQAG